ncbi:hypothetical protein SAMN05444581_104194 [Methylocapsa palsarum]|uniref:Uncharacterized protein n=1 Tax=Methylocapsa palsarum TaxID=1612308 RepID=A0A1I3XZK6_9HYPH|nr:hypothetical protein SAMN05444581_104194 [Methylocapsa palsarum]
MYNFRYRIKSAGFSTPIFVITFFKEAGMIERRACEDMLLRKTWTREDMRRNGLYGARPPRPTSAIPCLVGRAHNP